MAKQFSFMAAQGDVLITKIDKLPDNVKEKQTEGDRIIVAHSETGHHHFVERAQARFFGNEDPMVCYLKVDGAHADLVHDRPFDTHEKIRISKGLYELRRQREHTPQGWRRVED